PALRLVQRLRDEAHRFALGYHQKLRRRRSLATLLEEIPGIGPKRRRALLKQFGSLEAIRQANLQELAAVEGVNEVVAQRVRDFL
ncbi:MAG: helix-hairpin-helix domain-containing protein, partial [Anaerolineae bacterium]